MARPRVQPIQRVIIDGSCPECGAQRFRHLRTGETWCSDPISHAAQRDAGTLEATRIRRGGK